jgi:peptide-methionine (S)-S-oxide reductase
MTNKRMLGVGIGVAALVFALARGMPARADDARMMPAPAVDVPAATATQTAVFSGGCFWGVQGVFEHVKGVKRVLAGYAGGAKQTAQYETVSGGDTGHAESVQIEYDPTRISYGHLLQIFFSVALDPTQVNAQGPDEGTQYRSEIWTNSPDQSRVAKAYIAQLSQAHAFPRPIATRVDSLPGFYPAEDYHQDFLVRNPTYPYIVFNDMPKVTALKQLFPGDWLSTPVLSGAGS